MYTATLLTAPTGAPLAPEPVAALRNAWGGREVHWLSPGRAAEFGLAVLPGNLRDVWTDLQKMDIDLAVQKSAGRRKRMLLADMDSTMIRQECIDELAEAAGVGDDVRAITARAMNGELDFESALKERVGLLKGLDAAVIDRVLADRIEPMPGGRELVATMRAGGGYAVLVSGGFTAFSERVAEWFGFDENRANRLLIENGTLTGEVARPILGRDAKVRALEEISGRIGLSPADAIAVGDGANDLGMLGRAGTGVALHAKPAVAAQCDLRINHGDLTALLYLQGYSDDEILRS